MPPVQPSPTMTASTSLSLVTMVRPPSAHVRDADWIVRERFVLEPLDVLPMDRDGAREADELPARFVAVAAVDRVGEHALHHSLIDRGPELAHRQAVIEGDFRGR